MVTENKDYDLHNALATLGLPEYVARRYEAIRLLGKPSPDDYIGEDCTIWPYNDLVSKVRFDDKTTKALYEYTQTKHGGYCESYYADSAITHYDFEVTENGEMRPHGTLSLIDRNDKRERKDYHFWHGQSVTAKESFEADKEIPEQQERISFFENEAGVRHGLYKRYDHKGVRYMTGQYCDGKKEGKWHIRSKKDGHLVMCKEYDPRIPEIVKMTRFHADGKTPKAIETFYSKTHQGRQFYYYPNGQLKHEAERSGATRWGVEKHYRKDGLLIGVIDHASDKNTNRALLQMRVWDNLVTICGWREKRDVQTRNDQRLKKLGL